VKLPCFDVLDSIQEHFHISIYLSKYPPLVYENRYVNKWEQEGTILLTHSTLQDNILVLLLTVTDALHFSATAENRLSNTVLGFRPHSPSPLSPGQTATPPRRTKLVPIQQTGACLRARHITYGRWCR
jgi:hypothetical protein